MNQGGTNALLNSLSELLTAGHNAEVDIRSAVSAKDLEET